MRAFFVLLFVLTFSLELTAQNSIRPNIYLQDMQYYNPASVAIDTNQFSQTAVYGKYKSVDNDDDIWKKPMTFWLSHVGRIGKTNSFYTISYVNDVYSFYNRNAIYVGFVQQKRIGKSSTLSFSGRIIGNLDAIQWEKFKLPHTENGSTRRFNPDLDLGITYQFKKLRTGLGVKNVFANSSKIAGSTLLKNHREFNVDVSYRQNIGRQFAITPFLLLANERSTLIDAGLSFSLLNKIRASYALRVNELKSVITLDVDVYKGVSIGLAYDRSSLVSDKNFDVVLRYRR